MGLVIIIGLSILLILSIWFGTVQYKARIKSNALIISITNKISDALENMRKVDQIGAFQSTDEVGFTFQKLYQIVREVKIEIFKELQK